jgi:hypothetical protein
LQLERRGGGGGARGGAGKVNGFQIQICKTDTNKRNKIIKQKKYKKINK